MQMLIQNSPSLPPSFRTVQDSLISFDRMTVRSINAKNEIDLNQRQHYVCEYDLILTDCSMPFIDGYDTCSQILNNLRAKGINQH